MSETKKYKVLSPVNHDHKIYTVGKTIELSENQAKQLLDIEVITPVTTTDTAKGSGGQKPPAKPAGEVPKEFEAYDKLRSGKDQAEYFAKIEDLKTLETLVPYTKSKAQVELSEKIKKLKAAQSSEG